MPHALYYRTITRISTTGFGIHRIPIFWDMYKWTGSARRLSGSRRRTKTQGPTPLAIYNLTDKDTLATFEIALTVLTRCGLCSCRLFTCQSLPWTHRAGNGRDRASRTTRVTPTKRSPTTTMYPRLFKGGEALAAYAPLASSSGSSSPDGSELDFRALRRRDHRARRWVFILLFIFWNLLLVISGLYGIQAWLSHNDIIASISGQSYVPRPIACDCGSSIAEARDLGCSYDNLAVSWLPQHCRDDALTAEFEAAGPGPGGGWSYWADANGTQPLTVDEISLLADKPRDKAVFFASTGWHVAHCAFYWRKEFRMRAKGFMMESRYDRESHIEHCYSIFMSNTPLDAGLTRSVVRLGGDIAGSDDEHLHGHGTHPIHMV